jgi:hypothetical protein
MGPTIHKLVQIIQSRRQTACVGRAFTECDRPSVLNQKLTVYTGVSYLELDQNPSCKGSEDW